MRKLVWGILLAGLWSLGLAGCGNDSGTTVAKDTTAGDTVAPTCEPGSAIPASLDLTGSVFRVIELRMEHPDSATGYIKTQLNGLWAMDIQKNVLNLFFKVKAWQPAAKKLTLSIGTGQWDAVKSEYFWDSVPTDVDLDLDNPDVQTPGRYGLGTLDLKPAAVNAAIHIINLAIQGQLECDGAGIYGGALQGSIKRSDAKPLLVKFPIGRTFNEIGLVNFLEVAQVFTDKATSLPDNAGIAEPCPFTADLKGAKVVDGWCIPKKDTAFWDKDCAKNLGCKTNCPTSGTDCGELSSDDADDERCAVEVKDNAVVKTICVQPDAWHFTGTFSAEKIDAIREGP
ncbi:MAG: hypothetical protein ACOYOB_13070 [Myxococcota bacterium]